MEGCFMFLCLFLMEIACGDAEAALPTSAVSENERSRSRSNNSSTCPRGFYGYKCWKRCKASCSACDTNGTCLECSRLGVKLPGCTVVCDLNRYGKDCKHQCSSACLNAECERNAGFCLACRDEGFSLPSCTVPCLPGTYGMHCRGRCPTPCKDSCDRLSGLCITCDVGEGPHCTIDCAMAEYQETCRDRCPEKCVGWCNTTDRRCSLCSPGYKAPHCREYCDQGSYGSQCKQQCSSRCSRQRCDPITGECMGCVDGYVGKWCNGKCVKGLYGAGCSQICPETCVNTVCKAETGDCEKCLTGYTGSVCDRLCDEGKYGDNCSLACPPNCRWPCDPVTGECRECLPGYQGPSCNVTCSVNFFGLGCNRTCPIGCLNEMCHPVSGKCTRCKEFFRGPLCDRFVYKKVRPLEVVVYSVLSLLMPVVLLGVVMACYKQRSTTENKAIIQAVMQQGGALRLKPEKSKELQGRISKDDIHVVTTDNASGIQNEPTTCNHEGQEYSASYRYVSNIKTKDAFGGTTPIASPWKPTNGTLDNALCPPELSDSESEINVPFTMSHLSPHASKASVPIKGRYDAAYTSSPFARLGGRAQGIYLSDSNIAKDEALKHGPQDLRLRLERHRKHQLGLEDQGAVRLPVHESNATKVSNVPCSATDPALSNTAKIDKAHASNVETGSKAAWSPKEGEHVDVLPSNDILNEARDGSVLKAGIDDGKNTGVLEASSHGRSHCVPFPLRPIFKGSENPSTSKFLSQADTLPPRREQSRICDDSINSGHLVDGAVDPIAKAPLLKRTFSPLKKATQSPQGAVLCLQRPFLFPERTLTLPTRTMSQPQHALSSSQHTVTQHQPKMPQFNSNPQSNRAQLQSKEASPSCTSFHSQDNILPHHTLSYPQSSVISPLHILSHPQRYEPSPPPAQLSPQQPFKQRSGTSTQLPKSPPEVTFSPPQYYRPKPYSSPQKIVTTSKPRNDNDQPRLYSNVRDYSPRKSDQPKHFDPRTKHDREPRDGTYQRRHSEDQAPVAATSSTSSSEGGRSARRSSRQSKPVSQSSSVGPTQSKSRQQSKSPGLVRCATTRRQVSPEAKLDTQLVPLPTPPTQGRAILKPVRKLSRHSSMSNTDSTSQ